MRRVTVHHHIWFKDVAAETGDEAAAVVKQALTEMHEHCQTQLADWQTSAPPT